MSRLLNEWLIEAREELDKIHTALGRQSGRLLLQVADSFRELAECRSDIDHLISLFDARTIAFNLLDGLGQTHFAKCLTKLKRRTTPIAHVDQYVENSKELLGKSQRHRCVTMCEMLHQFGNARR